MKLRVFLLSTTVALAAPSPRHVEWCRAAVFSLPRYYEDADTEEKRAELDLIAQSVAVYSVKAPRPPREWASLILTVWDNETHLSRRIIAGQCKKHECDAGRARGGGQVHRNALNGSDWDNSIGNIDLQVKLTSDALRRAYGNCQSSGVPWTAATLSSYAGKRCSAEWKGLGPRLRSFNRLTHVQAPSH